MGNNITKEELIIELQPFSRQLIEWCKAHPIFTEGLKIIYPKRFITLQAIVTSHSPLKPEDQVIGFYSYDRKLKKFKQDFIVNIRNENKEFILYSVIPNNKYGKHIKHINEFYQVYSKGIYYIDTHHPKFEQLPDKIKERGQKAKALAERLDKYGFKELTQTQVEDIYNMSRSIKRKTEKFPGPKI